MYLLDDTSWSKLVDKQMVKDIVDNTNIYIRKVTADADFYYRKKT